MKPAEFDYTRPTTVSEALEVLASAAEDARVLAGGQSLVPLMNLRLAAPGVLVDVNRIGELDRIERRDGGLVVGAIARQADVEASPDAAGACPLLVEALHHVGHPQLRNRGTVVGSLAHHDPAAELPAVAVALGARLTVAGPQEVRTVDAADFFTTYFTTSVDPDELVTDAWFPAQAPEQGSAFVEIARRRGDFAMVGVAATVTLTDDAIASAAIVLSGMAERPVRCAAAESALLGNPATDQTFARAGSAAVAEDGLAPSDDVHGTAAYRRALVPVVVESALHRAAARANA